MRIAVITCEAYRDAWEPFRALLDRFWPDCPYQVTFHSESYPGESWCSVVARCAVEAGNDPTLMMMEDFFLTAPVHQELVQRAAELLDSWTAGCVRLHPMPGATDEIGDPQYGIIRKGTTARISCQAAIWKPEYLWRVAMGSMTTTSEAGDFENLGTPFADSLDDPVLAFKRDVKPWPMEHMTSAIDRGLWNPDAIRLCAQYGIPMDRSLRPVAAGAATPPCKV